MKLAIMVPSLCLLSLSLLAQSAPTTTTVSATLDHNRVIIDVYLPLPDGSTKRVRGWVDSGSTELWMTDRVAKLMGLTVACDGQNCSAPAPTEIVVGDMKVPLAPAKEAKVVQKASAVRPGLSAEITLPSAILRNFDVVVDYPNRELTLAAPSTILFEGAGPRATINRETGLITLPATISGEAYILALDLSSSFTLMSSDVVSKLQRAHPQWPHMTGAVGAANMWGGPEELTREMIRLPEIKLGPLSLTNVAIGSLATDAPGTNPPTSGLLGANALLNYRVGIDYAHNFVYFDKTSKFAGSDMDVIGLTLRPESDGRYLVTGVADFAGRPSVVGVNPGDILVAIDKVPAADGTMGQVWSLLGGRPGEVRTLTLDRDGKQFTVKATVRSFLATKQPKPPTMPAAKAK